MPSRKSDSSSRRRTRAPRRGTSSATDAGRRQRSSHVAPAQPPQPEWAPRTPHELYRHEKARRARQERPADDPLEQARKAFQELLKAEAASGKGGRPKTVKPPARRAKRPPDEFDLEEHHGDHDGREEDAGHHEREQHDDEEA